MEVAERTGGINGDGKNNPNFFQMKKHEEEKRKTGQKGNREALG